jgi:hypothetical protein
MSVTVDDAHQMPPARRPRWLRNGASEDPLYVIGSAQVRAPLSVRVESGAHALVQPADRRSLKVYEADLAATREHWRRI